MSGRVAVARLVVLCLVAAAALAFPSNAWAQEDDFRRGLDAREDRQWADVVRYMQAAIKIDGQESKRTIRTGGVLFFGRRETEYLPHFFLGEAFFEQKNCVAALTEWETSEQQGVVAGRTDFVAIIRKRSQECASRGILLANELKTAAASTRQAHEAAVALAEKVVGLMSSNEQAVRPDMRDQYEQARVELETSAKLLTRAANETRSRIDFETARQAATRAVTLLRPLESSLTAAIENLSTVQRLARDVRLTIAAAETTAAQIDSAEVAQMQELYALRANALDQLTQARTRLNAGESTRNESTLQEAMRLAQSSSALLTEVAGRLTRRARETFEQQFNIAVRSLEEALSFVDASMASLERLAVERPTLARPDVTEQREKLRNDVEALRRRFDRALKGEDLRGIERTLQLTVELRGALDPLIKSFGPVSLRDRGVHIALEEAARSYLAGEYQQTLAALSPPGGLNDIPLQLHVHLFRAASHYALWVRSGGTDQSQRDLAAAEIARCKQLNAAFQPDPRAFSPSFIAFYRQGAAAAAAPGTN
jgi:hypothetical protein